MSRTFVALVAVLASLILPVASPTAEPVRAGHLTIEQPWARASIGTSRPAAAYFTVTNESSEPDRLTAVASPVSGVAEIHAMTEENGVMRMHPSRHHRN